MNSEYNLFLDMDGVLVDFDDGYHKLVGNSFKEIEVGDGKDSARQRYLDAGADFWVNLNWIQGGKELWNECRRLFSRVSILSSTGTSDPERGKMVDVGKRMWLKKYIPELNQSDIFVVNGRHMKTNHVSKNGILVDDMSNTIQSWNFEGGIGILHDSKFYNKTIESLRKLAV